MLENSLEEGDDLGGEDLGSSESLGVEHHLGYELTVRLGHCKAGGRRKEGREGGRESIWTHFRRVNASAAIKFSP